MDLQLRRRGIDTIVLGGVATHIGVDTTARDAYQLNYNQFFVTDMMSAQNETLHQFPIDNVFPLMGQTITTNDFREQQTEEPEVVGESKEDEEKTEE